MMRRSTIAPTAVLVLALALGGCLSGVGKPPAAGIAPSSPAVEVVDVGNVTPTSAVVTYRVAEVSAATWVRYTNASAEDWDETPPRSGMGLFEVELGPLRPGETYSGLVVASHDGAEVYSRPFSFSTHPVQSPPGADPSPNDAEPEVWIQPGMLIRPDNDSHCTLAFILRDASTNATFALTAGHCLREGQSVFFDNGTAFGTAEVVRDDDRSAAGEDEDWALIRIDPAMADHVSPEVLHWTGPTELSPAGSLGDGDWICFYGQAGASDPLIGLEIAGTHQCGSFERYRVNDDRVDHAIWRLAWPGDPDHPILWGGLAGGDSGGPVLDYATGQAVGIIVWSENLYWQVATTVYDVMAELADMGYNLEVATAPYDPPPPDSLP